MWDFQSSLNHIVHGGNGGKGLFLPVRSMFVPIMRVQPFRGGTGFWESRASTKTEAKEKGRGVSQRLRNSKGKFVDGNTITN